MKSLMSVLMPSCKEVTGLVASDDLASASWGRRLSVRVHLAMCEHCSRFARQLHAVAGALRAVWAPVPPPDLAALKRRVLDRLRAR